MSRSLHIYLDEADRLHAGRRIQLVGAIVTPAPIAWTRDEWYAEILRYPHATEGRKERRTRKGLLGEAAWTALSEGRLKGATVVLLGGERQAVDGLTAAGAWEVSVAATLAWIVLHHRLTDEDSLVLHPDRRGASSDALAALLQGVESALRWAVPGGRMPGIDAQPWAKDPNDLIGVSLADLILWNVARRVADTEGPWVDAARGAFTDMGMTAVAQLVEVPALHDPESLQAWVSLAAGRLDRVDWARACIDPIPDLARLVQHGLDRIPAEERPAQLASALAQLAPYAEDPRLARQLGLTPALLCEALEGLAAAIDALGEGALLRSLRRRQAYLSLRARSHLGEADQALAAWDRWSATFQDKPLDPVLLNERLDGMNARAVVLSDLELWDEVEETLAEELASIARYLGAFERVPAKGKALGALYQARILSRRQLETVPKLIAASAAEFDLPADWSWGWTWTLVGLGRGMPDPDPLNTLLGTLSRARDHGMTLSSGNNPYLLWGVVEALARPGGMGDLPPGLLETVETQVMARLHTPLDHRRRTPLLGLTLRAWARVKQDEGLFEAALQGVSLRVSALRNGDLMPRTGLRTLAAWVATCPGPRALSALTEARQEIGETLDRLPVRDELRGVRAALQGFLDFDAAVPGAAEAWLAKGGY